MILKIYRTAKTITRQWGTYYMAGLLFKTYFKLGQQKLCQNVKRAINSTSDLPPFQSFPKAHQITFGFYQGLLYFLEQDYHKVFLKQLYLFLLYICIGT